MNPKITNLTYAPVRYEKHRDYVTDNTLWLIQRATTDPNIEQPELEASLVGLINKLLMKHFPHRPFLLIAKKAENESKLLKTFAEYDREDRHIYEFSPYLLQQLFMSELADIQCGDVQPPKKTFYIFFNQFLPAYEGAFIQLKNQKMVITGVARQFAQSGVYQSVQPEETDTIYFDLSNSDLLVSDALFTVQEKLEKHSLKKFHYAKQIATQKKITQDTTSSRINNKITELEDLIKITFLSILYIQANAEVVENTENTQSADTRYRLFTFAEDKTSQSRLSEEGQETVMTSIHAKKSHYRSGHFRKQRHGKSNQFTKLIYIPPSIINNKTKDN